MPNTLRLCIAALAASTVASAAMAQTAAEAELARKPHAFSMRLSDGNAGRVTSAPNKADQKLNALDGGAYWVAPQAVVSGAAVASARVEKHDDGDGYASPVIRVTLTEAGRRSLAAFTAAHVGQSVVYVLDDQVIGNPVEITSAVEDGTFIVSRLGNAKDTQYFAGQIADSK